MQTISLVEQVNIDYTVAQMVKFILVLVSVYTYAIIRNCPKSENLPFFGSGCKPRFAILQIA